MQKRFGEERNRENGRRHGHQTFTGEREERTKVVETGERVKLKEELPGSLQQERRERAGKVVVRKILPLRRKWDRKELDENQDISITLLHHTGNLECIFCAEKCA